MSKIGNKYADRDLLKYWLLLIKLHAFLNLGQKRISKLLIMSIGGRAVVVCTAINPRNFTVPRFFLVAVCARLPPSFHITGRSAPCSKVSALQRGCIMLMQHINAPCSGFVYLLVHIWQAIHLFISFTIAFHCYCDAWKYFFLIITCWYHVFNFFRLLDFAHGRRDDRNLLGEM